MSDTPRTDAAHATFREENGPTAYHLAIDFARRLERENVKLRDELSIVAAELTAVQQENIADGCPPALAINHRLNSVMRVLAAN